MPAPGKVEEVGVVSMNVPLPWTTCSQLLTKLIHPAGATKVAVGSTGWPNHPRVPGYLQVGHNAKFTLDLEAFHK